MAIFESFSFNKNQNSPVDSRRPSVIDVYSGESTDVTKTTATKSSANDDKSQWAPRNIRYVNFSTRTQHGSLERALDAARVSGKPILAHFVPPTDNSNDATASSEFAGIFSDPQIVRVIEECFVAAVFHTADRNDPKHGKAVRLFGPETSSSSNQHCLRIITPDGQRVVVGTDNVTDKEIVRRIMVQALEELGRHVPKELHGVRPLEYEPERFTI